MGPAIQISFVIITDNEEDNIRRCLASIEPVADEIVVVDSFSEDLTPEICRSYDVRFFQREWAGYSETKNYANELAEHDYIFSIDADEALSGELQQEIRRIKTDCRHDGYIIHRLTNYCGRWIRHCGWYPDRKLRLWNRKKGKWSGTIHEKVDLAEGGTTGELKGDLLHYSFNSISDHVSVANRFSSIAAEELIAKGENVTIIYHLLLNPFFTFIKKYVFQRGFMDGYYGFIICVLSALSNFLKYGKVISRSYAHVQEDPDQPD